MKTTPPFFSVFFPMKLGGSADIILIMQVANKTRVNGVGLGRQCDIEHMQAESGLFLLLLLRSIHNKKERRL
ncbi:unnamed protein product [Linum trigynum]|uniref:Uncharacterized protein n=1 Tax=Linum trigynum TaxID=586398 RepID=A0AAV2D0U3_9ROSI